MAKVDIFFYSTKFFGKKMQKKFIFLDICAFFTQISRMKVNFYSR